MDQTKQILAGALDGDAEARGALLERMRPRLLLWVTTRLGDALRQKVEPDDVVQEILVAVHKGLDSFKGDSDRAFMGWMFKVAENRIRDLADHFSAQKRQLPPPLAFSQTSPSAIAVRNEMAEIIRKSLTKLSDDHRRVIQLRRFEERSVAEIAEAMERSENAVRVLYFRAVAALREEMEQYL